MGCNFLFCFFLLFIFPFNGSSQTIDVDPQREQAILLGLKLHWSNPPSLSHWTPSTSHCRWPEITCSSGGAITGIRIVNGTINERIPAEICDLANLSSVDLSWNFIPGTFPTIFYNCSVLEHLDLSRNSLVGVLPGDVNRLSSRLESLILTLNNFSGDIPPEIGGLSSLKRLYLGSNLFNGSVPEEIGNLFNLEELVLSYNPFLHQPIPQRFTQLKKLRNLWMPEANLVGQIPVDIGNMSALESLDFSTNGLNGSIPSSLFLLKNMTELYLYKNKFSGSIPGRIESLNLRVLDLSNNSLTGEIPDEIGNITTLTGLALFFNQLSGQVPVSISRLPRLIDFGVFSNNLSGELPPEFGLHSKLETFQVSSNHFSGELPQNLCINKALVGVIAFENHLSGELPSSLSDCNNLIVVRVHDNLLSGSIPDGLWRAPNLGQLMLSNNMFTGQLPEAVGPKLSRVELMGNQFSGPIPVGISSWESLTVFRASNNSLSGEIPQALTDLPSLTDLLLDMNQLSGPFPTIVSWISLTTLNLSSNRISGTIPPSIGQLPDLVALDLSNNELSGQIPPSLGNLALSYLNLSHNLLTGQIPAQFENAAFDTSFLSNPGLCSNTPSLGINSCIVENGRSRGRSSRFIPIISSIAAVAFFLALLYAIFVFRCYRTVVHSSYSDWKLTSFQRLNFTESNILRSLTDDNLIGRGGSGSVYRVPLSRSDEYVAVKKICSNTKLDWKLEKEFHAEVRILGTIRHENIVKLLCCISGEKSQLLVYEYMQNHSLDAWLHRKKRKSISNSCPVHPSVLMDWPKRLRIAIGAAHGLCYMHHHCSPPIIHRDVKSSNILLDSDFNAKIADFGLARILTRTGEPNTMSVVAGSFGYMAPEYAQARRVNEKIDVYSFGVVLLELVTGREAHNGDERSSLAEWVWRHVAQQGKPIVDILDDEFKESQYMDDINTVLKLGLICTNGSPLNRPQMRDVLQILLQCSQKLQNPVNSIREEQDVSPLLHSSKSCKPEENHERSFIPV